MDFPIAQYIAQSVVSESSWQRTADGREINTVTELGTVTELITFKPGHFWEKSKTARNTFRELAHFRESSGGEESENGG